jgi:hypothetical protein
VLLVAADVFFGMALRFVHGGVPLGYDEQSICACTASNQL